MVRVHQVFRLDEIPIQLEYIDPNEARIKQAFDKSFSGIVLPDFISIKNNDT